MSLEGDAELEPDSREELKQERPCKLINPSELFTATPQPAFRAACRASAWHCEGVVAVGFKAVFGTLRKRGLYHSSPDSAQLASPHWGAGSGGAGAAEASGFASHLAAPLYEVELLRVYHGCIGCCT